MTIYVAQPVPNDPEDDWNKEDVGHAFISIKQNGYTVSYGFYPKTGWGLFGSTSGIMGNDQSHEYDVNISNTVSGKTLDNLITHSISYANSRYNIQSNNCSSFIISSANIVGFDIPISECIGKYGIKQSGPTPAKLGGYIKSMTLPKGSTRNTSHGIAPANNSCH